MKNSPEFQTALREAQEVLEQRDRIKGLISADRQRLEAAEAELKQSCEAMASAEADALISGTATNGNASLKKQRSLRDEVETLGLRISGLEQKLLSLQDVIVQKADALNVARSEFVRTQVEELAAEYKAAAERFIVTARKGATLAELLGSDLPGLGQLRIPNLFGMGDLVSVSENRLVSGVWERFIPRTTEIDALANELAPVTQACNAISREAEAVRKVRSEQERAQKEAEREQQPVSRAATLPVSAFSQKALEQQEAANQRLREAFQVEHSVATMYPERR